MADDPKRSGKFSLTSPGLKEYAIIGGGVLALVLVWTFIRARQASQPAAAAAAPAAGAGTSSMTTTVATSPEVLRLWLIDHARSPRHRSHGHRHQLTWFRQVASGTRSLEQVARERQTSVRHIEDATLQNPEITAANKERFRRYVQGGTARRMPAGLIFYTSNAGSGQGHTNVGGGVPPRRHDHRRAA